MAYFHDHRLHKEPSPKYFIVLVLHLLDMDVLPSLAGDPSILPVAGLRVFLLMYREWRASFKAF